MSWKAWSSFALLALVACSDGSESNGGARVCPPKTTGQGLPGLPGLPGSSGLPGLPGLPGTTSPAGSLAAVASFGDNPGALQMHVYVPKSVRAGTPVIVAMHGCTQTAAAYAAAGWNELADAGGFVVVYPEQTVTNDGQRCFRWWDAAHITRDRGEAKSIRSMVEYARTKHGSKDAFVTGLSAGGAMTAVMLATYPDVFRAGAIMSGLPYACAKGKTDAYACMSGRDQTAAAWGALLPALATSNPPRVSIWQGEADYIVRPANAEQLVRQWTRAHGLDGAKATTETIAGAEHAIYRDRAGAVLVERWLVPGMSHGVALDPKKACGKAGAFLLDEALCSTAKAAEFFQLKTASGAGVTGTTPGAPDPCD